MSDQPPELPSAEQREEPEVAPIPRWVPIAIGIVLVSLAALAVVTGLRYRDQTLVNMVRPRHTPQTANAPAPPGEPEPGASLVFPGESGANIPEANPAVQGAARAEIRGGGGSGVTGVMRIWARRGMTISATPSDAVVYVNDVAVGQASQFDSDNEIYDFAAPGSYTVRLVAPGYKERQYIVTASENAGAEVAKIAAKLEKE